MHPLRREGLTYAQIGKWCKARAAGTLDKKRGPVANPNRAEMRRLNLWRSAAKPPSKGVWGNPPAPFPAKRVDTKFFAVFALTPNPSPWGEGG